VDFILDTDADGKDAYRIVRADPVNSCSKRARSGNQCHCKGKCSRAL